ncbi:4-(cytidine 5'-diphospho)-2-C-methyl-D-erythritol kinase [Bacillaceae bacterium W0354]
MIFEKAPAKINLTLDVLRKREDGYHEVEMILTTIDLSDRLILEKTDHQRIEIVSENRFVPSDARNLAYQAAERFREKFQIKSGVKISIEKQIPVAAGLAGGSSDAAATLRGMNRLFEVNASINELQQVGAEIGSDIPFCVMGGTALAKGRGEILQPLPSPPPCWVVLAKPTIGVSTKSVYGKLNLNEISHPNTDQAISALKEQNLDLLCLSLGNVLEPVTSSMHPEVQRIKEQMVRSGANGVLMSGSGPTVYALVKQQSRAERVYNSLRGFCQDVYVVRILR